MLLRRVPDTLADAGTQVRVECEPPVVGASACVREVSSVSGAAVLVAGVEGKLRWAPRLRSAGARHRGASFAAGGGGSRADGFGSA